MWQDFKQARLVLVAFVALIALAGAAVVAYSYDNDSYGGGDGSSAVPSPTAQRTYATPSPTAQPAASPSMPSVAALKIGIGQSELGRFLTAPDGKTLYVFTRDAPNTSNCTSDCLSVWPPLLASAGQPIVADAAAAGKFDTITTPSGKQVTYDGAPLYYYAPDAQPGDTMGHLVGGVWFVAPPDTASTAVVGVRGSGDSAYLVGPTGMTLYTFAKDTAGASNCSGQCLANWPALTVPADLNPTAVDAAKGALDFLTRADDGTRQVVYNGMPLYFFAADEVPGDTKGDGVGGVWSTARP
jgi:predicted lipoprotein with Yx(FWY)xxD motif